MRTALAVSLGLVATAAAATLLVLDPVSGSPGPVLFAIVALVAIAGLMGAVIQIAGSADEDDPVAAAPWNVAGALVDRAPERTPDDHALSGERLAEVVEDAGETARDEGTVEAGVAVVRPELRRALVEALVQGGTRRETATDTLADGSWTDDRRAAAVLDESVRPPRRSFRERLRAWLFPEEVLRADVRRGVQAIADVADRELPTVPGRSAPRTVPVLQPRLEDLRRGADGRVQRAVDPLDVDPTPGELPLDVPDEDEDGPGPPADGSASDGSDDGTADPNAATGRDATVPADRRSSAGGVPATDPDPDGDEADDDRADDVDAWGWSR